VRLILKAPREDVWVIILAETLFLQMRDESDRINFEIFGPG